MRQRKQAATGRRLRAGRQARGAALLPLLAVIVMAALVWLVHSLSAATAERRRAQQTEAALMQAKEVLLGYAMTFRDEQNRIRIAAGAWPDNYVYGYLPLPDLGTGGNTNIGCPHEGCDANLSGSALNKTVVGRFPWRLFGIAPLRDGHGECLWYIVSGSHQRIEKIAPMNSDTLGQIDIVATHDADPATLRSLMATAHDRPVAIVLSPGPLLDGQNRGKSGVSDVTQCGGNYNPANYLDPDLAAVLRDSAGGPAASAYFSGATATQNTHLVNFAITAQGRIYKYGAALAAACPPGNADCMLAANDTGLALTSAALFSAIGKNAHFRADINAMLDRMTGCLRDQFLLPGKVFTPDLIAGVAAPPGKRTGRIPDQDIDNDGIPNAGDADFPANGMPNAFECHDDNQHPGNYFSHYKDQVFVVQPDAGSVTVNGEACAGALLFAGQRAAGQTRASASDRAAPANYLEGINRDSFTGAGTEFTGDATLERAPPQAVGQDIVRCIPASASLSEVTSPALDALGGQLVKYDPATRALTLGRNFSISNAVREAHAPAFFGCSWTPETHAMGSGFRSYFRFNIADAGEGFVFAIIDGERNAENACGAARAHLGYSGDNGVRPPIAYPKIGIEIDTARQTGAYGNGNSDDDGRADPDYAGGHAAIVYWGADDDKHDDNAHGQPAPPDAAPRPPPRNPVTPLTLTQHGAGVARLDATGVSSLLHQDIHVRVEVSPLAVDRDAGHTTYRVDVWLVRGNASTIMVAAMKNTTRPLRVLYPTIDSSSFIHLTDQPEIHDTQGDSCAPSVSPAFPQSPICPPNQTCGADGFCHAPAFAKVRLGFTTSQSTVANDQIVTLSDFFTTWLP
ncbi:MAG: hypothetical protein LBE33_02010 [Zoogloeaceae bacterium]|jgi:hypothetical protein|nr:hypothetical protein [Zoogloeaceae bacterium]